MRFSMLYSGEQILSFKLCLVFYTGDSLTFGSGAIFLVCYNTKTRVKSDKNTCILTGNKYQK